METPVTATITIHGRVQGVGFRPLVCRLAQKLGLTGRVCNAGDHVRIDASGTEAALRQLCDLLRRAEAPVRVHELFFEPREYTGYIGFTASDSETGQEKKIIPADLGICPACLAEMRAADDRRRGYPYISCARCGPRYTILQDLPYDRDRTSMEVFSLCADCRTEYTSIENRRGHGETISCYACGPQLQGCVKAEEGNVTLGPAFGFPATETTAFAAVSAPASASASASAAAPLAEASRSKTHELVKTAQNLLQAGKIIMVKAVGGFNLVCKTADRDTVARLRDMKKRPSKPFAVMVRDMAAAEALCYVSQAEKDLLLSPARPIVLLQKKEECDAAIAVNVTDVSAQLGLFLPPMGLYEQLTEAFPLIVTSCNYAGEPILYRDEEALRFYEAQPDIAGFFTYNRAILRPADDSVAHVVNHKPLLLRRGRGYLPEPVVTEAAAISKKLPADFSAGTVRQRQKEKMAATVLAVGAEMEPGFCLGHEGYFYPGIVPGDITLEKTAAHYTQTVQDWLRLLHLQPDRIIGDLHPAYAGTLWGKAFAREKGISFDQVQHHQAHALSVMAEHGLKDPVLAVCFDGTGYGTDGTVWGGEFLRCEGTAFQRVGHIQATGMLGGDVSMQQAWKTALCYLAAAGEVYPDPRLCIIKAALEQKINVIKSSSVGRLFDAAAFLLGLADFNSHQGRCAMALESAARRALKSQIEPLVMSFRQKEAQEAGRHVTLFDPAPLWSVLCQAGKRGAAGTFSDKVSAAALGFHEALAQMVAAMAEKVGMAQVVLGGGCFANAILLQRCCTLLQKKGFRVYYNEKVSPGDGGISLGQAYYGVLKDSEQ